MFMKPVKRGKKNKSSIASGEIVLPPGFVWRSQSNHEAFIKGPHAEKFRSIKNFRENDTFTEDQTKDLVNVVIFENIVLCNKYSYFNVYVKQLRLGIFMLFV